MVEARHPVAADAILLGAAARSLAPTPIYGRAPDANLRIDVALDQTWGSLDQGIRVLPKQTKDGVCLIVVNEWQAPLRYTLTGLGAAGAVA